MEEPEIEEAEMEEADTEETEMETEEMAAEEMEVPGTSGTQVSRSLSGPAESATLPSSHPYYPCPPTPPHTPQLGSSFLPTDLGGLPL